MRRRTCPLCAEDRPQPLGTLTAQAICSNTTYRADALHILNVASSTEYGFGRCRGCGFIYALEEPDAAFLDLLYDRVIDSARASLESQQPSWVAHQLHLASLLLERISGRVPVRVLDYGCGYGTILRALSAPSVICTGYEISATVAAAGRARQLDVFSTLDEIRARGPFDGIVLSDVLEHVVDPRATLATCRELLTPNGWICVNVPDFSENRARSLFDAIRRGVETTREINPWEHLNYFSPRTLAKMVESAGFKVEPYAALSLGLRRAERPVERWGNAARSVARMLAFTARPRVTSTTVLAERSSSGA
ncbi:MAG TPA: class I SAM-dependent methyltransferase [Thermoanaerobaculia bacterium]|jgi:2-polyprenyl-3-methyl-5-hydroxy-6-metoxy-1,4-benzoquinol methylase